MELPGNQIALGEEYLSSKGTFEEKGIIYAAVVGEKQIQNYAASITARKGVEQLKKGDTVIGVIQDLFDQVALVKIEPEEKGKVATNSNAYLRISEVTQGYAKRFRDYLRIGDVIRGEVIDITSLGIYLTIARTGLGVIKTRSSKLKQNI